MKVGLVLEGGAMRGMYTAGVLDYFMEKDVKIDEIVGVSAGVLFGVNYVSKQKGRAIRYNKRFVGDKRYMSFSSLIKTGNIVGKEFAYYEVPYKLDVFDDETYKKSNTNFTAAITNVNSGQTEYVKIDSVFEQMETLRATSAMPYVSKFVRLGEEDYLDGGITDSIPIEKCLELDCDRIIVILTRPLEYRKKKSLSLMPWLFYHKYPNLVRALNNRYKNYNYTVEKIVELEKKKEIFVIRPTKTISIDRIEKDVNKLQEMYNLGVNDAKEKYDELIEYLK